ncbi:protein PIN-LIKES 3-like [Gossypium arboreum]|uniref:protein PIN-LIKES 3-like n=1 Tax=Gossypium arboreum TaxID=29729 RepID=UPI0022F1D6D5|nr:protein PIN-LIKES 3-like [Gossypium arboreum]
MDIFRLFIISLMPVLKVLLVIIAGLILATQRFDLLGCDARRHLNNMVFYVFYPALIGCGLADTMTLEGLADLWFLPVNVLITCVIGSILGWILVIVTKPPRHLWGLVISCTSAANLGNMLLIILPALCEEKNNPFGGVASTCSANGKAYASLSLAVYHLLCFLLHYPTEFFVNDEAIFNEKYLIQIIYIWSVLYFLLRMYANNEVKETNSNNSIIVAANGCTKDVLHDPVGLPQIHNDGNQKVSTTVKFKQLFMKIMRSENLRKIFAPATIAAIVGFLIGIATPIRKTFIGDNAPLRVIYSATELIGNAGIPSITLIVGANLLKGLSGSGVGPSVIIGILIIRNIFLPISGIGVIKAAKHLSLVDEDSFYLFTLLIQYAIPPAMNIGTISQMLGSGESEFSMIMLWNYIVAILTLTFWIVFYMWLVI